MPTVTDSSVHALETPPHLGCSWLIPDPDEKPDPGPGFRHSGWRPNRTRVYAGLRTAGCNDNRLERFRTCGANAWVLEDRNQPGHYRLTADYCHDRFCQPCATERSHRITHNLCKHVGKRYLRFITLTLRTGTEPLTESLDCLFASFTKVRRSKVWTTCIDGGVAFLEVKWNPDSQRWHPHLHCLVVGRYVPHPLLKAAWLKATGDSFVVDIRPARDNAIVGSYVTKYASKPLNQSFVAIPARLAEAIAALHGRKLCMTFGTFRDVRLLDSDDVGDWKPVCRLADLLDRVKTSDSKARTILLYLERTQPCQPAPRQP